MQGNRAPQNIFNVGLISCGMLSRCSLKQASKMWSEVIFLFFANRKRKSCFVSLHQKITVLILYCITLCTGFAPYFSKLVLLRRRSEAKKNIYSTQLQINHTYLESHLSLVVFLKPRGDLIY